MRKHKNYLSALLIASAALFAVSCDNNEEIKVNPGDEFDATLDVTESGAANPNADISVTSSTGSTVKVKVHFTSTTKDMKRLYITTNTQGLGEVKFKPSENIDFKADDAVDLTGKDSKNFEYTFALPVPSGITTGTVVYKFWTTTGNGDFRDATQRLAVGPGTITLKFGGNNPDASTAAVKSFANVQLFAPTADGNSKTFVSLVDGVTYNVSQGIEYVSLWDFGYLYSVGAKDSATLRAPYNYNVPYYPGALANPVIDIEGKSGATNADLNKTYFKLSTKTAADFDNAATSADLAFVSITASDDNVRITRLDVGNVVEFVDNYGKKGLIKVTEISGTNGSADFIKISIKVQP
jgi:hypothetical protein